MLFMPRYNPLLSADVASICLDVRSGARGTMLGKTLPSVFGLPLDLDLL
jgi:hypothetical protein